MSADEERNFHDFDDADDQDEQDIPEEEMAYFHSTESQPSQRTAVEISQELLTLRLLRETIDEQHPGDPVMTDFAQVVLPKFLEVAIGTTAKGGWFFEDFLRDPKSRQHAGDQSLSAHILNGLFPANMVLKRLLSMEGKVQRRIGEQERRLGIAGFILHDFEKFDYTRILGIPDHLLAYEKVDIRKLSLAIHREFFDHLVPALGLDQFISMGDPQSWTIYRDDLLAIAYGAEKKYGANLNLSVYGLSQCTISEDIIKILSKLARLADLFASLIKHPQDAHNRGIRELIYELSDDRLTFTYHAISENRGVLTNVINNALVDAHLQLNTADAIHYQPLLYLPTGVIYLTSKDSPHLDPIGIPDQVVKAIRELCAQELRLRQPGFNRDGKGMKYAEFYTQFFDDWELMQVGLKAVFKILRETKGSVASARSQKLQDFQAQGVLDPTWDLTMPDDIRVDWLAEFGDLATRKIWDEKVKKIETLRKTDKKLPALPDCDLLREIIKVWDLEDQLPQIQGILSINESLKSLGIKGATGGVPYEWYYLSTQFLKKKPGLDPEQIQQEGYKLIEVIRAKTEPILRNYELDDGWGDLRTWVSQVIQLPQTTTAQAPLETFQKELNYYQMAKKSGRGKQLICSVSHSPFSVSEQMESAVLFTPQVYTNKQTLGGSNAKRNISSIAATEMMLRQILMNQTQAVGKRFEDGKYRYLYFYPTYYFTPETNTFLQKIYFNLAQIRFNESLKDIFVRSNQGISFEQNRFQHVDAFLVDVNLSKRKQLPDGDPNRFQERAFKLSYPENKPLTFYFMALPPGRDPTDTESWVMPAWLGLVLPLIADVKMVVSESPIPPFTDGSQFEETVFLDAAPQAFRVLLGRDRFRLDKLLNPWLPNRDDTERKHAPPLSSLTAAYAMHLDVNVKRGKSYDPNWGKLADLASDLASSPLTVFSTLARRTRQSESVGIRQIALYAYHYYPCFDPYVTYDPNQEDLVVSSTLSAINHPKKLTELYRRFYRAKDSYNLKANAILKPVDLAADTLLKADFALLNEESLMQAIAAEVCKLMDRVHSNTAEGRWVFGGRDREAERQAVYDFARYFVEEIFVGAFKKDRARLAGKQLNLLKNTCEFLYRLEQDKENRERKDKGIPEPESEETIEEEDNA
ncbi:MAG: hypothetical protein OHK0012_11130 [Synechococcales cyanobacterium]